MEGIFAWNLWMKITITQKDIYKNLKYRTIDKSRAPFLGHGVPVQEEGIFENTNAKCIL